MSYEEFAPVTVTAFADDYLVEFVRLKTGWDQRSQVYVKAQLAYLNKYLKIDHVGTKTIVFENEYVDRQYLEDYAEYYSRCFPAHPRMCSRMHFFSAKFDEPDLLLALEKNDQAFLEKLQSNYIGYVVIRPIPHTFIARLCIRPYKVMNTDPSYRVITKTNDVSLFGVDLTVETAPFIEQDKVVAACATSAVWAALGATRGFETRRLPSPSSITKAAMANGDDGTRIFPAKGMTSKQISTALKNFGLEPHQIPCGAADDFGILLGAVYAYITSGTPVLIGGTVYSKQPSGKFRRLGSHLVCALGFHTEDKSASRSGFSLSSTYIDKIYVHDDRFGPYLRLLVEPSRTIEVEDGARSVKGFALSILDGADEFFSPDFAMVGVEHKVRVSFEDVTALCEALRDYLDYTAQAIRDTLTKKKNVKEVGDEAVKHFGELVENLAIATNGRWEITLQSSQSIKDELRNLSDFKSFNGASSKDELLTKNLPKHIWRCRIFSLKGSSPKRYTDILFDATEIPQGKIVIGYISFSHDAEQVWKYIEQAVEKREWEQYPSELVDRFEIGAYIRFFGSIQKNSFLNTVYGPLQLPRRELKPGEKDPSHNVTLRRDARIVRRGAGATDWTFLDRTKKYIWVINDTGDLVIGEDIVSEEKYQGHPTLMDGKRGRIGGELFADLETNEIWRINLKSRAYSSHLAWKASKANDYLANVASMNFVGLKTILDKHRLVQQAQCER